MVTVTDPSRACLLVPSIDTTCAFNMCRPNISNDLADLPGWNDGRNHVILHTPNDAATPAYDVGQAMLISSSSTARTFRPGFDAIMPLYIGTMLKYATTEAARIYRHRTILAFFSGCIYPPRYDAGSEARTATRRMLMQALSKHPSVVVSGTCCHWGHSEGRPYCENCGRNITDCSDTSAMPMREGHLTAKFVLCPEGAGPLSYRILEAMAAGAVPVVVSRDGVLPGAGTSLHHIWEECVVLWPAHSVQVLAELPIYLTSIHGARWERKRRACQRLIAGGFMDFPSAVKETLCSIGSLLRKQLPSLSLRGCNTSHWHRQPYLNMLPGQVQ
jgi:hypothetical protein